MPVSRVQAPDGRVISVEHPEGATPDQIISFAQQQAPPQKVGEIPVAPKGAKVSDLPGPMSFLGQAARERSGDILSTIATAAVPGGKGLMPFAKRLFAAEAGHDVGNLAAGNKVTPGYGAGSQLVGEGVAKAAAPLVSGIPFRAFASETAQKLADKLKSLVPAWADLPSNEKGLYEMVHVAGPRLLSRAYDAALQGVKGGIPPGAVVTLPVEDAAALGLKGAAAPPGRWAAYQAKQAGRPLPTGATQVELGELIDALPAARKGDMGLYRRALRAADRGLEGIEGGLGDEFMQARGAYRQGAGFIDHATAGKYLHGERFDPAAAQRALDTGGKKLMTRGMDEVRDIIRGPGEKPIEADTHGAWSRHLQGAALGSLIGTPLGIPGHFGGGAIGAALGSALPKTTYRNVPLTPAMEWASRVTKPAIAEVVREGGRQLDVPETMW